MLSERTPHSQDCFLEPNVPVYMEDFFKYMEMSITLEVVFHFCLLTGELGRTCSQGTDHLKNYGVPFETK